MANRDVLVELFSRIKCFFERLRIYSEVPPPPVVMNVLARNMADVLQIFAIATKGMKEKRPGVPLSISYDKLHLASVWPATFFKKLAGMNDDIKDALPRLRQLE